LSISYLKITKNNPKPLENSQEMNALHQYYVMPLQLKYECNFNLYKFNLAGLMIIQNTPKPFDNILMKNILIQHYLKLFLFKDVTNLNF